MNKIDLALVLAIIALVISALAAVPASAVLYGAWEEVRKKRSLKEVINRKWPS